VEYAFKPLNKLLFLFVISGRVTVGGHEVGTRDSLGIWETDSVSIETAADTRFLLIECPINH
jgi:redox-sensitive bicupin YhaK (pirin superfamily)